MVWIFSPTIPNSGDHPFSLHCSPIGACMTSPALLVSRLASCFARWNRGTGIHLLDSAGREYRVPSAPAAHRIPTPMACAASSQCHVERDWWSWSSLTEPGCSRWVDRCSATTVRLPGNVMPCAMRSPRAGNEASRVLEGASSSALASFGSEPRAEGPQAVVAGRWSWSIHGGVATTWPRIDCAHYAELGTITNSPSPNLSGRRACRLGRDRGNPGSSAGCFTSVHGVFPTPTPFARIRAGPSRTTQRC